VRGVFAFEYVRLVGTSNDLNDKNKHCTCTHLFGPGGGAAGGGAGDAAIVARSSGHQIRLGGACKEKDSAKVRVSSCLGMIGDKYN